MGEKFKVWSVNQFSPDDKVLQQSKLFSVDHFTFPTDWLTEPPQQRWKLKKEIENTNHDRSNDKSMLGVRILRMNYSLKTWAPQQQQRSSAQCKSQHRNSKEAGSVRCEINKWPGNHRKRVREKRNVIDWMGHTERAWPTEFLLVQISGSGSSRKQEWIQENRQFARVSQWRKKAAASPAVVQFCWSVKANGEDNISAQTCRHWKKEEKETKTKMPRQWQHQRTVFTRDRERATSEFCRLITPPPL